MTPAARALLPSFSVAELSRFESPIARRGASPQLTSAGSRHRISIEAGRARLARRLRGEPSTPND